MTRIPIAVVVAIGMVWSVPPRAQPALDPLRASLSLASDAVLHGLSQVNSGIAARFAIDFEHPNGFFSGGSLARVGYDAEAQFAKQRDLQLNAYAGFVWRGSQWMTNAAISRYAYPGLVRNYDYSQLAVTASFRERYFLTAARIGDLLSVYDDARLYRAGVALPVAEALELSVNAGRFRSQGPGVGSFSYWDIGLSRPISKLAIDLRFYSNTFRGFGLLGNRDSDLWVLSLTYALLPRGRQSI